MCVIGCSVYTNTTRAVASPSLPFPGRLALYRSSCLGRGYTRLPLRRARQQSTLFSLCPAPQTLRAEQGGGWQLTSCHLPPSILCPLFFVVFCGAACKQGDEKARAWSIVFPPALLYICSWPRSCGGSAVVPLTRAQPGSCISVAATERRRMHTHTHKHDTLRARCLCSFIVHTFAPHRCCAPLLVPQLSCISSGSMFVVSSHDDDFPCATASYADAAPPPPPPPPPRRPFPSSSADGRVLGRTGAFSDIFFFSFWVPLTSFCFFWSL